MSNSKDWLTDRRSVMEYLLELKKNLIEGFKNELTGVYVYGSLINEDGNGFSTLFSDVDITITVRQLDLYEHIKFLESLKKTINKFEEHLRKNLKKNENNEIKNRTFFPVISVCIATEFELNNGIHKNRNAADAFAIRAFHPLDTFRSEIKDIGRRLQPDLVGVNFPAWAIMTQVQEIRSNFVSPQSTLEEKVVENMSFDHPSLILPKELLRYTYLLDCFKNTRKTEMVVEDDLANGLKFIVKTLDETAVKEINAARRNGDVDIQETYSKTLSDKIQSNSTGKKEIKAINAIEQLYLWELLSIETEEALEKRRLALDQKTLELAADAVILELFRLRATTLMSVDMAISLLYKSEDLLDDGMLPVKIVNDQKIELCEFKNLDQKLINSLVKDWPDEIQLFLLNQFKEGKDCGKSECKVGFAGYLYTQKNLHHKHKLLVRPLTYWIIQQFNKQMATNPRNPDLRRFREKYGSDLFTAPEDFRLNCPSALYVEVVIVTKDNFVFKISKLAETSAFAKQHGGKVYTCGIEWGFSWERHIIGSGADARLDVKQGLMDGLKTEFSIMPSHIKDWQISTLAIQHAHLNAGLLGIVYLNLSRGDLYNLFESTKNKYHDNESLLLIPKGEASRAVQGDKSTGKWHQTALMRINLLE